MNQKIVGPYIYNMTNVLGRGAFGTVYLGQNQETLEWVAIKAIDKSKMSPQMHQQSHNEITSLRTVDNPNIVGLYEVLQTVNNFYIINEYCEGGDLRKLIQTGPVPENQVIHILGQILNAFMELQKQKIIHRDLTPANILIKNAVYKIADFGFSKQGVEDGDIMQSIAGTPLYMAPQILLRLPYTSKCDIWSIGIIAYELLMQKTPFSAQNIVELMHQIQAPIKAPSMASPELQELIAKCLVVNENERIGWEELFSHKLFTQTQSQFHQQSQPLQSIINNSNSGQKQKNRPSHKKEKINYQSRLIQGYFNKECHTNTFFVESHFNFVKYLFNMLVFVEKNQHICPDIQYFYEKCKSVALLTLQQLLNLFQGGNPYNLREIKVFRDSEQGQALNQQIQTFKTTFYNRYKLMDEDALQISINDSANKRQELQDACAQTMAQFSSIMHQAIPNRHLYLILFFMFQQIMILLVDVGYSAEDIQFVWQYPEQVLVNKINALR